jgi:hypothetical protein
VNARAMMLGIALVLLGGGAFITSVELRLTALETRFERHEQAMAALFNLPPAQVQP